MPDSIYRRALREVASQQRGLVVAVAIGIIAILCLLLFSSPDDAWAATIERVAGGVAIFLMLAAVYFDKVCSLAEPAQSLRLRSMTLMGIGIFIVILGAATIFIGYRLSHLSPPSEQAVAATNKSIPQDEPKPHYSPDDKDRISRLLNQLGDVLANQAKPMELEAQRIKQAWDNASNKRRELMPMLIERLENIHKTASDVQREIYTNLPRQYHRDDKLLQQIVTPDIPTIVTKFRHEAHNLIKQFNHSMALLKDTDDEGVVVAMSNASIRLFREATSQLNGWIDQSQKRIRQAEHEILGH